jgi:uncharacterized protein YceH (UPF0502 family)
VLVEKAKTTPNAYPMSVAAICTAANQKSNRFPVMQLQAEDVESSLERLRGLGAVGMIEGYGRVVKYRHYLYDWMGVDKVELAVMAELLLRGPQTEGELRGRAARMEPIADLAGLRPILASLKQKELVLPLTPEGRGHVVAHALYSPRELEALRAEFARRGAAVLAPGDEDHPPPAALPTPLLREPGAAAGAATAAAATAAPGGPPAGEGLGGLRGQIEQLRGEVAQLRSDVEDLAAALERTTRELEQLKSELGT